MINKRDLYTQAECAPITIGGAQVGTLMAEYHVQAYTDVRNLKRVRSYLVGARLRLLVPNNYTYEPSTAAGFTNYPIALKNSMHPVASGMDVRLLDYSPKTINTSVSTSQNTSGGTTSSRMSQQTIGSSTAQTNSYEVSEQIGFFGGDLTGGISRSSSHSSTVEQSTDNTSGTSSGRDSESGMASSMSIKDWGSYGMVDLGNLSPQWLWGQEFPWNVLEFYTRDSDGNILLPEFVQSRLYDNGQLFPPSQLSLYGVNFQASAKWLVQATEASSSDETMVLEHRVRCFTGSHYATNGTLVASIDDEGVFPWTSTPLNLPVLGLDPIVGGGSANGAVIGFAPQAYIQSPADGGGDFRVISAANNLYVKGTGFSSPESPTGQLEAEIPQGGSASLDLFFKVLSVNEELELQLKHWKTGQTGCVLSISVNGSAPFMRHVDALDATNGSDNITRIILRNTDYASEDYFDYLVPGLNSVTISIAASADGSGTPASCGYVLRAVAVG